MLLILAAIGFGVYLLGGAGRDERAIIRSYANSWARNDYDAMWHQLTKVARHRVSEAEFAAELSDAEQTATVSHLHPTKYLAIHGKTAEVGFIVQTHVFGRLNEILDVPLIGSGANTRIGFNTSLLFPGLHHGELLSRTTSIGKRGTLLAATGQLLARGTSLQSSIPEVAADIVGSIGPIPLSQATLYAEWGYPVNARVGVDGLEQVFQRRLAGRLGGELKAGTRLLARATPRHGQTVRTTIVPALEQDAEDALGGKLGGITIMDPRTGAVQAAAGIAFSDVQPPGSTFKIITSVAALQAGLTTPTTIYPYESHIVLDGFKMQNAGGESCGGSLTNAFANSCDTTFAPLGAQLGGPKLVAMAERFGFDRPTGIAGALESTIPQADQIGSPVAIGASAIGQGLVQASTLEITDVGATIADHGRRPIPTMLYGAKPRFVHVTTPKIAGEVQAMMEAVVSEGTGTTAQIPGVTVAGKTGTAELRDTAGKKNAAKYTDAWFVGYAPAQHPKVVVTALFPNAGYGADTAAPVVKQLIEDVLGVS